MGFLNSDRQGYQEKQTVLNLLLGIEQLAVSSTRIETVCHHNFDHILFSQTVAPVSQHSVVDRKGSLHVDISGRAELEVGDVSGTKFFGEGAFLSF